VTKIFALPCDVRVAGISPPLETYQSSIVG
jgi:hypothetical protein